MRYNNIWKKLTVGQYQLLADLNHLEGWEYMRSVVAIVEGNGFDAVDNYPLIDLRKRYEAIAKQLETEPFKPFKSFVKIDGKRYYVTRFFDEINTAQFVEISEWNKTKEDGVKNLHLCVASLLRETKLGFFPKKYNGKDHSKRALVVKEKMLAVEALGLSAFFLASWVKLLEDLPTYLDKEIQTLKEEMDVLTSAQDLPSVTDGL
jgi:hypothetical protein